MKSIKKTIIALVAFGGTLSMTSCGTISCWAYADNADEKIEQKEIKEVNETWMNATFTADEQSS